MTRLSQGLWSVCLASAVIATAGCAPETGSTVERRNGALAAGDPGNLDILFMIDNSSSMTSMQMKLLTQDPSFMTVLKGFPNGLPNLHVAVVSSDMGAPGDSTSSIQCTATGDNGVFQSTPRGSCTNTTLSPGATFISNVDGVANYTGELEQVFSCMAVLGSQGCGFEHQLASVARALGADGSAPPAQNAGFLRPDAELAIILLTNEDDCSAPANTTLYGLNGGTQSITNPLGPIANYRCNEFGHLCTDPTSGSPSAFIAPPLNPPADAVTGPPPSLNLTNCESNDATGKLQSVADFVKSIKNLKAHPEDQIVVGAISPPPTPYTVEWVPSIGVTPNELWPQIYHSCGPAGDTTVNPQATQHSTDGTFGDPGVRIAQWVQGFGNNGVLTSICDADYKAAFQMMADKIQAHLQPSNTTGSGGAGGGSATGVAGANGAAGAGGAAGGAASGTAGHGGGGGVSGGAGSTGAAGASGAAGTSGTAGSSGTAGTSGGTGTAGTSGGTGMAGTSGGTGTAGTSGSGTAGTSGGAGTTGGTGTAGAAGGASGHGGSGASGAGGHAGAPVSTGTGGIAGSPGTGGQAGTTGGTGTGTGGSPAAGGHAGSMATTGTGGQAGQAGATGGGANESGCGCQTSPGPTTLWGLLPLLGLVATRHRRRRN
jgi:MYXO-CTERM domain-containing protein